MHTRILTIKRSDGYEVILFRFGRLPEGRSDRYFLQRQPMLGPPRDSDTMERSEAFAQMKAELETLLDTESL